MSFRRETYNEIAPEDVALLDKLGQGEFGVVHRARWSSPSGLKEAAVKCLHGKQEEEKRVRLLQEAFTMGQFRHPHVVQLYGVVSTEDTVRRGWPTQTVAVGRSSMPGLCEDRRNGRSVLRCATVPTGDAGHGAPARRRPQELPAQCSRHVSM